MPHVRRFQAKKQRQAPVVPCATKDCPRPADDKRRDKLCENCGFFFDHGRKKANPA